MSLHPNLHQEEEEEEEDKPGSFLSLSASSSPPRLPFSGDTSLHDSLTRGHGGFGSSLTLQQPIQNTLGQQELRKLQPSDKDSTNTDVSQPATPHSSSQLSLGHAQEPQTSVHEDAVSSPQQDVVKCVQESKGLSEISGQQTVQYMEEPRSENAVANSSGQYILAKPIGQHFEHFSKDTRRKAEPLEINQGITEHLGHPHPSLSIDHKPSPLSTDPAKHNPGLLQEQKETLASSQGAQQEHNRVSWPDFSKQQKHSPFSVPLEHQRPGPLRSFLEQQKIAPPLVFPVQHSLSSLQQVSEQQQQQQLALGTRQGQQKHAFSLSSLESQKAHVPEDEKSPPQSQHTANRSQPVEYRHGSWPGHVSPGGAQKDGQHAKKQLSCQNHLPPQHSFVAQPSCAVLPGGTLHAQPVLLPKSIGQVGILNGKEESLSTPPSHFVGPPHPNPEQVYPLPSVTQEAVLADQNLFLETLKRFCAALTLQVSVPKVGERDLDLHKLYKEVTRRGGIHMVIKDSKWDEIVTEFNLPVSATLAASVLRGVYMNTLYHYEQVYFLGVRGKVVPPAFLPKSDQEGVVSPGLETYGSRESATREPINSAEVLGVDPASSVGTMVTGAIDGKFENGYLVTVMVGTRQLRGVLYHVAPTNTQPQSARVHGVMMHGMGSEPNTTTIEAPLKVGRKRKSSEVYRKDPNAPRQNRTGYNFFFAEQRAKLKTTQPDKDRAISKMIGDLWSKLSEDEKIPYQAKGMEDKERYVREMKEYKEKVKLPLIAPIYSKAMPSSAPMAHGPEWSPVGMASPAQRFAYMPEATNGSKVVPSQQLHPPLLSHQLRSPITHEPAHVHNHTPNNATSVAAWRPSLVTAPDIATTMCATTSTSGTDPKVLPAQCQVGWTSSADPKAALPAQHPSVCLSEARKDSQGAALHAGNGALNTDRDTLMDKALGGNEPKGAMGQDVTMVESSIAAATSSNKDKEITPLQAQS